MTESITAEKIRRAEPSPRGGLAMADHHHTPADPNAAPMHTDVRESFDAGAVAFCYILAVVALLAGLVSGLVVIND